MSYSKPFGYPFQLKGDSLSFLSAIEFKAIMQWKCLISQKFSTGHHQETNKYINEQLYKE